MSAEVRLLGDAAIVVTFGTELSEAANDRVMALARSLRVEPLAIPGVTDVVPAIASLVVHFDPRGADLPHAATALALRAESAAAVVASAPGPLHEIPVRYGGTAGPDLADVAAFAGCTPADVVERHARAIYRVYMLGFLPGFAYLGEVDPAIAAPRRPTPRQSVPAGSVGIAGRQTGVYPQAAPGGWQIVGQSHLRLFDEARGVSLLQPGDRVRFVPEDLA
ncbi:MAG: 5-oxoprolinase subunit PxpB [Acidobacteriota bacterium]|nr:5-oxoprolinase subunit PxpB [Acidobacteriota bacterium]